MTVWMLPHVLDAGQRWETFERPARGVRWETRHGDSGRAGGQHEDAQDLEAAQDLRHDPLHINVEHLRS